MMLGAVLALGCVSAAPAPASTWTVTTVPHGSVRSALYGASCPSASLCVAVGGNNTVAAANPIGGPGAWIVGHPGGSFEPPSPGEATYGGNQIRGVSCPSTLLCVAASLDGRIISSTNPTGGVSAWKIVPLGGEAETHFHMFGISCPTSSLCVAVGYGGKIISSTNPTGDKSAWTVTNLGKPFDLRGISCPSTILCVAVGNEGQIVASTDPTGGSSAWTSAGAPAGAKSLNGISCPSSSLCVTGNAGQIITSTDPEGGASGWAVGAAGAGFPVEGVSCPSAFACVAVDNNADVISSTDPTVGPASWWFRNVLAADSPGGNGMFGVSCPSSSLCVAAGQDDQVITSTDPFAPDTPKTQVRSNPGRLLVVITGHPAQRLDPHKGGVKVTFRFHAIGRAAHFKCKVSGRHFRNCGSPVHYRVGRGRQVFRVRAISPGGAKGPPASYHFRVGRLKERSPVGSCPAGAAGIIHHPCINARY